jgi:hypothetical protein
MNKKFLLSALGAAASLIGLFLLYRVVRRYDMAEITDALAAVPASTIFLTLFFCFVGYLFLIGAEYLAVRYTANPVSFGRVALTAVAALGIGHSIGLAALSSGTVRYRMYGRAGMKFPAVGRVVLFSGITVSLGLSFVGAMALLWQGEELGRLLGVSHKLLFAIAFVALLWIMIYLTTCALVDGGLKIRHFRLEVPSWRVACGQVFFGSGHLLSVAAVLYASLRSFTEADYPTIAALYVGADMAALVGHVPGGWGLIEYIVTSALEGPQLLAGLIIFRASYYLLPLAIGVGIFVLDEFPGHRRKLRKAPSNAMSRHR